MRVALERADAGQRRQATRLAGILAVAAVLLLGGVAPIFAADEDEQEARKAAREAAQAVKSCLDNAGDHQKCERLLNLCIQGNTRGDPDHCMAGDAKCIIACGTRKMAASLKPRTEERQAGNGGSGSGPGRQGGQLGGAFSPYVSATVPRDVPSKQKEIIDGNQRVLNQFNGVLKHLRLRELGIDE